MALTVQRFTIQDFTNLFIRTFGVNKTICRMSEKEQPELATRIQLKRMGKSSIATVSI